MPPEQVSFGKKSEYEFYLTFWDRGLLHLAMMFQSILVVIILQMLGEVNYPQD